MGDVDQECTRCEGSFTGPVNGGLCPDCTEATRGTRKDGK